MYYITIHHKYIYAYLVLTCTDHLQGCLVCCRKLLNYVPVLRNVSVYNKCKIISVLRYRTHTYSHISQNFIFFIVFVLSVLIHMSYCSSFPLVPLLFLQLIVLLVSIFPNYIFRLDYE
jgi:hypothetical protein